MVEGRCGGCCKWVWSSSRNCEAGGSILNPVHVSAEHQAAPGDHANTMHVHARGKHNAKRQI